MFLVDDDSNSVEMIVSTNSKHVEGAQPEQAQSGKRKTTSDAKSKGPGKTSLDVTI